MSENLRRQFNTRSSMIEYLQLVFSDVYEKSHHVSDQIGGRKAAEVVVDKIAPMLYGETRNYIDGKVTRLSPYIRHGVVTLSEIRDKALEKVTISTEAEKLITELGYRDYFQRVYILIGNGIWQSQEEWKTGFEESYYSQKIPDDILMGHTGLVCIDSFANQLVETGYLHNHIRMYFAAYIIHWRHVHWIAGARWFLEHLIDGDPASNNLSWQWIASTFSHKPYYFNRENLEKFTNGKYCEICPLYGSCDFEGSYERLSLKLFPNRGDGQN